MNKKALKDCQFFFLDSGVIIDLVKTDWSKSPADIIKRVQWVKRFFANLEDPEVYGRKRKIFQVSAISLAEIFHIDNSDKGTIEAVLSALSAEQVEICAFDELAAAHHNSQFYELLSNKEIERIKKIVNYPANSFASIRDRIRKDIMIASTAKMMDSCVVLTNDGGFQALCGELGLFCHCFTQDDKQFVTSTSLEKIYDFATPSA